MRSSFLNILILVPVSFLFLALYVGFYNYLQVRFLAVESILFYGSKADILLMGFKNGRVMTYIAIIALTFSTTANLYLRKKEVTRQIFKKAIVLALILFGLFLIYRLTSSIVNRYFNLNALKNISISAIIMFPLFLIIILPVTYLLNQNKTHTK